MIEVINKYETIMVINPTLEEDKIEAIVEKFKALISANGEVTNVDVCLPHFFGLVGPSTFWLSDEASTFFILYFFFLELEV